MADSPFVGGTYSLASRGASVQRTVNMMPVPLEPGNERAGWVFKDVPGLVPISQTNPSRYDVFPPSGLFYADFNDGTATDLTPNPAPFTLGATAVIAGGYFKSVNPITSTSVVSWAASKLDAIAGAAFTIEGKVKWTAIANATVRRIFRVGFGPGGTVGNYDIAFYGNTGEVRVSGTLIGSPVIAPNVGVHVAFVKPAAGNPRLYAAGALIGTAALVTSDTATPVTIGIGNPTDQGTEDYGLDWIRLSLGELYTGSTYTPP